MTKYWLKITIILYILWLILSGIFEPKFLIIGLVSSGIIARLCLSSMWVEDEKGEKRFGILDISLWKFARYCLWLFVEIVKASLDVAKLVVQPKMKIDPQVIEFDCWFDNPIGATILVNSIILTPGTVTLDVIDERHFIVHALTYDAAKGLLEGNMQRHIAALFEETP
ncbi:MAG: Na+/H+ antiporter subunit E [Emergencia sp.]